MQNEWNPIIIIEEWEKEKDRRRGPTQTVFKWRKNLHNKSNRERVFQLSALIKMFSYINRPNQRTNERTPFRGGNVLGNWNQNTREDARRHGMENVKAPAKELEIYFWPLNLSACLASHGDNFSILSICCSIDSGNIWIIQNALSNSVLLCCCSALSRLLSPSLLSLHLAFFAPN